MSYLVLARKYRPQSFDQVVEQTHVTKTLTNAILSKRVAHAILLSGPRGTGKTTIARILAKSMNCIEGPTPSPCNVCRSCTEITSGHSVDVFEIDGASNNSVDQVRELRENIRYMPAHSSFKIYIIDEVHMLSTAAFNALLKTLEEPPGHVMFIFATTEVHKIPVTILSRCQRHELRRLPLASLQNHLVEICRSEQIDIPVPVLETITRESGGSMRDALSLLDQLLGSMPEGAGADELLSIIGVAGRDIIHSTCEAILKGDMAQMLKTTDEVYSRGLDMTRFYHDIISYMRDLVLVGSGCGPKAVQINDKEMDRIKYLSSLSGTMHLAQLVESMINSEQILKFATSPRIAVEMIFMRLIHMKEALSVHSLIMKIDDLKKNLGQGMPLQPYEPRKQPIGEEHSHHSNTRASNFSGSPDNHHAQADTTSHSQLDARPVQAYPRASQTTQKIEEQKQVRKFPEGPITGEALTRFWDHVLRGVEKKAKSLYTMMTGSKAIEFNGTDLLIEVSGTKFATERIQSDRSKAAIKEAAEEETGVRLKNINIKTLAEDPSVLEENRKTGDLRKKALNSPIVNKAVEIFGGKVKDIKILGEESI